MNRALLFLPFLALVVLSGCASDTLTGNVTVPDSGETSQISLPLEGISTTAKWFEYDSQDVGVRFFAVKASDGSVKTAFDMCDVCYTSKKGYRQEGSDMVCNNCGNRYPINGLGTENRNPGGCWPSYLPNQIVGDSVVIEKADLEKLRGRFA